MLPNQSYSVQENNQVSLEEARELIEGYSAVNLDEVSPEIVSVTFREFVPDGQDGYRIVATTKEISTWVPMFAFNSMLANQKRMQRLRKKQLQMIEFTADEPEGDFDLLAEDTLDFTQLTDQQFRDLVNQSEPALLWQAREVLTIWKMTPGEGQMSLKRLVLGLTFEQIQGLFSRFFGAMLHQRANKA